MLAGDGRPWLAPWSPIPTNDETMIRTFSAAAFRRPAARWRVAVALASAALAPAVAGAADTLRIAASRAPVSLPLYVAQQRGFFADEHLDEIGRAHV